MNKKVCNFCGEEKDNSLFYKHSGGKYGTRSYCKACIDANSEKRRGNNRWRVTHTIASAKNRGIDCCSKEEFVKWIETSSKTCHYCGRTEIDFLKSNDALVHKYKRMTIDRVDNEIGYYPSNMKYCCFRCNAIKSSYFNEKEMKMIGQMISNKEGLSCTTDA